MTTEKSLKKSVFYNTIKIILSLIFPLISFPYVSRVLLPDNIGKVNFATSIISYFSMFAMLGINAYGIRECAKLRDDKEKLSTLTLELISINSISMIISYLILTISIFIVPKFFEYRILLIIYSATIIFNFMGMEWLYSGLEEFKYITIRSFIFQLLSIISLFIFIKTKEDYIKYSIISVCATGGSNIFNLIHSRKFIDFKLVKKIFPLRHLRSITTMFGISITASIFTMLDTTMVGLLSTSFQVGLYSASIKGVKLVRSIISVISSTLMPRVSYYVKTNNIQRFNELLEKNLNITLFFSIPATILFTINSPLVIQILSGKAYSSAIPCVQIIALTIFFSSISLIIDNQLFIPLNKEYLNLIGLVIGAVIDFVLNCIFIPTKGAIGACIGTVVAEGVMFIYHIFFLIKYYGLLQLFKLTHFYLISGITLLLICFITCFFNTNMISTLIISLIGSIIYILILYFSKNPILYSILKSFKGAKE